MSPSPNWRHSGGMPSGTRFLENLAYLVPGYRGYKDKELRQEEDSRLRSRVLAKLQVVRTLLDERRERLQETNAPAAEGWLRRLRRVEALAEAVRYAPYGFSGFFEAERVREETLERLLETDLLLFQDLDDAVEVLRAAPIAGSARPSQTEMIAALDQLIDAVETRLVTRDKVLADR